MTITAPGTAADDDLAIRPAERADLLAISRIEQQSFPQPWPFEAFEGFLETPGFLVGEVGWTLAGYVIADTVLERRRSHGHIKDLAVDPSWRGRGVGTRLLDRALALLEGHGVTRAKLEVRPSNEAAISIYRRFGFEPHHLVSQYYDDGEPAAVFAVDLPERWRPFG